MNTVIIFCTLLIGTVLCQDNELNLDQFKDQIPGFENFNQSLLPPKEEVEKVLREKCKKNGGETAFDDIINSKDDVQACFQTHINTTVIMDELEEAKKTGSMDEVFGKYCKKRPEILECVSSVTKKVELCLEKSEKENLKIVMNVTESLLDFICFKDGDRLAMFVAEGGFECLQERKDALQMCANETLSGKIPTDLSITNLPLFTIGQSECSNMVSLQECAVKELEKCKDNTPANIVEALFKFIKRVTPCKDFKPESKPQVARNPRDAEVAMKKILEKVKRSEPVEFSLFSSFRGKCIKYAGPNAYSDLKASVDNLKTCVQEPMKSANACERLPNEVRNCTKNVINKLRVCLPPQESYIPSFAHSSVDSVLHYMCDNNGQNYNKLMFSATGLACLFTNPQILNDCLDATKSRRTSDNSIVLKTELCEDLDKVKICLSTYLSNQCAEFKDFKQITMGIVDSFKAPCAGCSLFVNNVILFVSVLFTLRKFL